jgi:hypothetical protein
MATKHESPSKKCVSDFGDSVLGWVTASGDPDVTFTMSRHKFVCEVLMANKCLFKLIDHPYEEIYRDNVS